MHMFTPHLWCSFFPDLLPLRQGPLLSISYKETHYVSIQKSLSSVECFFSVFTWSLSGTWFSAELGRFTPVLVCCFILSLGPWSDTVQVQCLTDKLRNRVPSTPSNLFITIIYTIKENHSMFTFPIFINMCLSFWVKTIKDILAIGICKMNAFCV